MDRYVHPRTEVKDLLSRTWLGHPLHPVLTDVVLGAWTSSFLLDLVPGRRTRTASDRLVDIGILAAVPTALAGLSDWADVWVAPGGWDWSTPAPTLSRWGCTCARRWPASGAAAAWLVAVDDRLWGDHRLGLPRWPLSFGKGIGVDHTAFDQGPTDCRSSPRGICWRARRPR